MPLNFLDKRILITGASKGLGKAAAIAFEKEGSRLALAARSEEKLEMLKNTFDNPGKHLIFNLDLLDTTNIKKLANDILKKWGGVDVILHCIGGSFGFNESLIDWLDFSSSLKSNIGISSEINRLLVPNMMKQGAGNIIHVSSNVAFEARASVPYNTAKAALSGYIRSLGNQLAGKGIIISGILPGAFFGDDNAMFRRPEILKLRDLNEEDTTEIEASKHDLAYIKLGGSIGCMVNGAGLAMATMDIIKLYRKEPANFLDVGGGASKEKVAAAFKLIMSDKNVKGILINIFGGIMRCDVLAQGVVDAAKEINLSVPLVVRLAGTNYKEGKDILEKSKLKILSAEDLNDAAKKIVEAIN